jgi:hypothetical protein
VIDIARDERRAKEFSSHELGHSAAVAVVAFDSVTGSPPLK